MAGPDLDPLADHTDLIRDELNVKEVVLTDDVEAYGTFVLRPAGAALGPVLGGATQDVMRAARQGDWSAVDDGRVEVAGHVLTPDQYEFGLTVAGEHGAAQALPGAQSLVHLDTQVDDDLVAEGLARDLIRVVQQARKERDLVVTDRIDLELALDGPVRDAAERHEDDLRAAVLATSVRYVDGPLAGSGRVADATVGFDFEVA